MSLRNLAALEMLSPDALFVFFDPAAKITYQPPARRPSSTTTPTVNSLLSPLRLHTRYSITTILYFVYDLRPPKVVI
jgi:hypothetical protein